MFDPLNRRVLACGLALMVPIGCAGPEADRRASDCQKIPSQVSVWDVPAYMTTQGYASDAAWQKVQDGDTLYACYRGTGG